MSLRFWELVSLVVFPMDFWKRIILVVINGILHWVYCRGFIGRACTAFVEYIVLVQKKLKAFLVYLYYFVHLSEE